VPDGRKALPAGTAIVPVEVPTREGAPIVADDDAIWVEHWYYLKDELISQFLTLQNEKYTFYTFLLCNYEHKNNTTSSKKFNSKIICLEERLSVTANTKARPT